MVEIVADGVVDEGGFWDEGSGAWTAEIGRRVVHGKDLCGGDWDMKDLVGRSVLVLYRAIFFRW